MVCDWPPGVYSKENLKTWLRGGACGSLSVSFLHLHLEAGKGRVVLEPSDDELLEAAGASVPHLRRGVDLKEANELLI